MGVLFAALLWSAVMDAQVIPDQVISDATDPVRGRPPVVTIQVDNETVSGAPAATGHQLKAEATVEDPDGDTITLTTYRWLRGDVEVGTQQAYTTVAADAGEALTVEVTATTDPDTTDPSSGTGTLAVPVGANAAPVAIELTITGTHTVGRELTGAYRYSDADGDPEGTTTFQWYRADDAEGTNRTAITNAETTAYTLVPADQGKFVEFEVTPVASTGSVTVGLPVSVVTSAAIGGTAPVAANVAIGGTTNVTDLLTGTYEYDDAEDDAEGDTRFQWYRADDNEGTNRTAIANATSAEYTIVADDQGHYLEFEVTPKSATGSPDTGVAVSAFTAAAVSGTAPVASEVEITGDPVVGQTLSGDYAYDDAEDDLEGASILKWYRADDEAGSNRAVIAGATSSNYTVSVEDEGKYLIFEVTPKSSSGTPDTGVAVSATTSVAATGSAPIATRLDIGGATNVGVTLNGSYTYGDAQADPESGTTFQWYRATDAAGSNRTPIDGETGTSYTIDAVDQAKYLVFEVVPRAATGTPNEGEPATAVSAKVNSFPVITNPRFSAGNPPEAGKTITGTANRSDVDGDPVGYINNWYRADNADGTGNVVQIAANVTSIYTVTAEDVGQFLVYENVPTSTRGSSPGVPARAVSGVVGGPPVASALRIDGDLTVGNTVTGYYEYDDPNNDPEGATIIEWCRWSIEPCTQVGTRGQTGTDPLRYTLQEGDVGGKLALRITPKSATGAPGTGARVFTDENDHPVTRTTARADNTAQVLTPNQANYTFRPLLDVTGGKEPYRYAIDDGELPEGLGLDAETGVVSGEPTKQQTASPVTFSVSDANGTSATVTSTVSFSVTGGAPVASNLRIGGTLEVGQTLTGAYDFDDPDDDADASTFQWYRANDAAGADRTAIDGEVGKDYEVAKADDGKYLVFEVTPKTEDGVPDTGTTVRVVTALVSGRAPVASGVAIEGDVVVDAQLTGDYTFSDPDGDLEGATTFQWYHADGTNRTPITGATGSTYTIVAADLGKVLLFEVTPKSQAGTPDTGIPVSAATATTVSGRAPVASAVAVTGTPMTGQPLGVSYSFFDADGDDEDVDATVFRWYRSDDADGTNEAQVGNAGNAMRTRTVLKEDVGKYLRVGVEPVSKTGNPRIGQLAMATQRVLVGGAPPLAKDLRIDGDVGVNAVLTGFYAYDDPDEDPEGTTTFRWYRADDADGTNRAAISGAQSSTYTVVAADLGKFLLFEVTPVSQVAPTTGTPVSIATATAVAGHAPVATEVAVTGTPITGQQLTVAYQFADADGDAEDTTQTIYRWYRADDDAGTGELLVATGNNVRNRTVQVADVGKYLRASVQPVSLDGTPAMGQQYTSGWLLVGSAPPTLAKVEITNIKSPVQGQLLAATVSGYADADGHPAGTHQYQWYRNDLPIDGATATTYPLVAADVGAKITLGVVPKSATGNPDTGTEVKSAPTETVVAPPTIAVTEAATTYSHPAFNFNLWKDGGEDTYFVVAPGQAGLVSGPGGSTGASANGTYSVVTVTARSGSQVKLRGQRDHVNCANYMNAHVRCGSGESRITLRYVSGDNLDLPAGTHEADFELEARVHPTTTANPPFRLQVSMRIVSGGPLTATPDEDAQTLTVGQEGYSFRPLTASGGTGTYTYSVESGTLPTELTLNGTSGEITGTPDAEQAARTVVFMVKDSNNTVATTRSTVTFKVNAPLTATPNETAQVLTVGQANYTFEPLTNVAGGEGEPYTWSVSSGRLPNGLDLDETTGEVSGEPTEQQSAADVQFAVQDASGSYAATRATVSFTVNGGAPVASAVSIEGQPGEGDFVGDELTGRYTFTDADLDLEGDSTFQWYRADDAAGTLNRTAISGAVALKYTATAADQGKYLVFEVTPKSQTGSPDTGAPASGVTSLPVQGSAPVASNVAITGDALVNQVLTGSYIYDDAENDPDASTFQWYRADNAAGMSNRTPIDQATAKTYTVTQADDGKYLVFEVTPKSSTGSPDTGTPVSAVTASTAIGGHAPVATEVGFTGINMVGQTLRATYKYDDEDGDEEGDTVIQWCWEDYGCGAGWYGETFTLRTQDAGWKIEVRVTPKSRTGTPNVGTTVVSASDLTLAALTAVRSTTAQELAVGQTGYTFSPLTNVTGGKAPYTCAVAANSTTPLPAELEVAWNADVTGCTVTGSPTATRAAGDVIFEVKDANGASFTGTVRYTVVGVITAVANNTLRTIGVNTATDGADVLSVSGGVKPYTCEHDGTLPVGLQVGWSAQHNTCRVTGTPTVQQEPKEVTFSVKDAQGVYATTTSSPKFEIRGTGPVARNVKLEGDFIVGGTLRWSYDFFDADGDLEGATEFTWCRRGKTCEGLSEAQTYVPVEADLDHYINGGVTPVATTGHPTRGATVNYNTEMEPPFRITRTTATSDQTAQVLIVGDADYSFFPLADARGGKESYTWVVSSGTLPEGLSLDNGTGEVSGTPSRAQAKSSVVFRVKDANDVFAASSSTVDFTVHDVLTATAGINTHTLTAGTTAPAMNVLNVSGGIKPWACVVSAGVLPDGLELDVTDTGCQVNGTPTTQQASAPVTFKVKDARNTEASTSSTVHFTINGRAPVASRVRFEGDFVVGSTLKWEYDFDDADGDEEGATVFEWCRRNVTCEGTSTTRTYTLVEADAGHHINGSVQPKSRTGTPDTGAKVNWGTPTTEEWKVVRALTATANTTSAQYLTWGQTAPTFSPFTSVSGGNPPYSYSIQIGTLPPDLTLNANGTVTGTPMATQAAANVVFQVADADGVVAATTSTVSYTVDPAFRATDNTTAQVLTVGVASPNFTPLASVGGGRAPYTYTVHSGTLPEGITMSTGGVVSGTPTATRTASNVVFRVTDANGAFVSATVSYTVNGRAPEARVPGISGDSIVGQTLTANYNYFDADGDPEGGTTFNWCWQDEACGKGSTKTRALTAADLGKRMSVEITPKSSTGTPNTGKTETVHTGVVVTAPPPTATVTSLSSVAPIVGQTLNITGNYVYNANGGAAEQGSTYQWYMGKESNGSDKVPINGATQRSLSYTVKPNDQNRFFFFAVTPRNSGGTGAQVVSAPTQRSVWRSTTLSGARISLVVSGMSATSAMSYTYRGTAGCNVSVSAAGFGSNPASPGTWVTLGGFTPSPNQTWYLSGSGCTPTVFELYFSAH